jgi:flavin-dependent dehydrogenase
MRLLSLVFACLATGAVSVAPVTADTVYDIVVYGGTSAGVAAAVQAARMGTSVVLIEPGRHLGGMTSGGLGATDIGNKKAIGGLAREFYRRIKKHYADDASWKYEKRSAFKGPGHDPHDDAAWTFEPHVAEKVFNDLVREHRVPVVLGQRLDLKKGVVRDGRRLTTIHMESGQVYRGKMFIDATYEGDLMALAGVSYHVGREANSTYGESLVKLRRSRPVRRIAGTRDCWTRLMPEMGKIG